MESRRQARAEPELGPSERERRDELETQLPDIYDRRWLAAGPLGEDVDQTEDTLSVQVAN